MSRRCLDCPYACERDKLACHDADIGLLDLLPNPLSREDLTALSRKLDLSAADAGRRSYNLETPASVVESILRAHAILLSPLAELGIAGKWREGPVEYGSESNVGKPFEEIPRAMTDLAERLVDDARRLTRPQADRWALASAVASFMYRLFVIHPFRDGNGRTARTISSAFASGFGFSFDRSKSDRSDQRRYRKALETADRKWADRPDQLERFTTWCASRLSESSDEDEWSTFQPPE